MKITSVMAFAALVALPGCAGTRMPKLAKCTGPYRYANTYGTVLPSLPIPGQPQPPTAPAPALVPPASTRSEAPPTAATPASPAPDASKPEAVPATPSLKTSALTPFYPSC